jgi:serine/threonine-protein kinase
VGKKPLPPDAIPGFRLDKRVERGVIGSLYNGIQISPRRRVIIRILDDELSGDRAYVDRFLNEARAMVRLRHDSVVPTVDCGQVDNRYYMVTESMRWDTLEDRLAADKTIPEKECLLIVRQICRALDRAREKGVLHLDLRPRKLYMTPKGQVKVRDLGLAKPLVSGPRLMIPGRTSDGTTYTSPEQLQGKRPDHRADMYALGVMFYQMLSGAPPFDGPDPVSVAKKHMGEQPRTPRALNEEISPEAERLVLNMLAKDPRSTPPRTGRSRPSRRTG